jgi:hypothetical protein
VSEQRLQVDFAGREEDGRNQAIPVMPKVEDQNFADHVGGGECRADVGEAVPIRGYGDAEPVERLGSHRGVLRRQFPKAALADHVHKCYQNDNTKTSGNGFIFSALTAAPTPGRTSLTSAEQLTYLLFLKMDYERTRPPHNKKSTIPDDYNWASLVELDGLPLERH